MAFGAIAAFWGVSLLLVLTPGADWAYAIAAGLRYRSVVPSVGGLLLGHLAVTALVAAGVAALVNRTSWAMTVLTVGGAAYLVWLGVTTLRRPGAVTAGSAGPDSRARQVFKGAGTSGLNPKVFLLFLALLPQFTQPSGAWPLAAQIVVLGLVHTFSCAVVYTGVGAGARAVLQARPAAARVITRVSGVAMIVLGLLLLGESLLA
ncbi:LysE family translocator [Amycolatopsis acidicola]|uniref:LysE family translocator n=2 Tax=Amycolatopsis acidicola TaxID=2596893 RepID=A0A5N0V8K2_9PSEU|nr:LysE family translocator [Amycolatopsis acidicola]